MITAQKYCEFARQGSQVTGLSDEADVAQVPQVRDAVTVIAFSSLELVDYRVHYQSIATLSTPISTMPPRTVYRPPAARVNGNEPPRGRVHPTGAPNKAVERATRFTISNTGSSKHASSSLNEDGSINFEYILTPSRSSGVDKGGDMLVDGAVLMHPFRNDVTVD